MALSPSLLRMTGTRDSAVKGMVLGHFINVARLLMHRPWCGRLTEAGDMALSLSLPRMEGTDLRPWVPPEHSLVISSARSPLRDRGAGGAPGAGVDDGIPASFLAMQWHAAAGLAKQKLQARK